MKDKSLNPIILFFLLVSCSILIGFGFFCASVSNNQLNCKAINKQVQILTIKIDSLENIINTSFKEKRDTTIIQVHPQEIKVYYNKEN